MRTVIVIFLLMITNSAFCNLKSPNLKLKFDKVMMYDFSGAKGWNQSIVNEKGQLASSVTKQIQLDKESVKNLGALLSKKSSFGGGEAACFEPHLGFVYYLRGKIVAHITICLDCNVLVSSIRLKAQEQGKVGKGKDAYYIADGPGKSLRLFLNELLRRYNFSHQIKS